MIGAGHQVESLYPVKVNRYRVNKLNRYIPVKLNRDRGIKTVC